jgi:hypothetical protein
VKADSKQVLTGWHLSHTQPMAPTHIPDFQAMTDEFSIWTPSPDEVIALFN